MIDAKYLRRYWTIVGGLIALIFVTVFISLSLGSSDVSADRIIPILLGQGTEQEEFIVYTLRMPRIVITLLAGMALAVSGAIFQSVTKNDLAEPGIIGINAGAGVAVTIFFLLFPASGENFMYALPIVAFVGAGITTAIIFMLSRDKNKTVHPTRFILVGVGMSMALSGLNVVLMSSAEQQQVDFISEWLSGAIWGTSWPFVIALLPWVLILVPLAIYFSRYLDVLNLSEGSSIGLGVSLNKVRYGFLVIAVALAAAAVSVTGCIAFIGLLAPHIARKLVGPRNQYMLPVATLIGGWLLLAADTIGRNLALPEGIPAGIIVSLIGAPYLIYLLMRD